MNRLRLFVLGSVLITVVGCKKSDPPAPPPPPPAEDASTPPPPPPPAGYGTVRGKIVFKGTTPVSVRISTGSDPACAAVELFDESVVVNRNGTLKNVVVSLADSPEGEYGPSSAKVTLLQKGCRYEPRVMAVEGGTTIAVTNGDRTLHNVHTYKRNGSTWFNQAQPPGSPPMEKRCNELGQTLKFKCDVHPWMTAFIVVTDHQFFAVTGDDGSFILKKIPAGRHILTAWHEKFGQLRAEVTVAPDSTTETALEYSSQ